jgi:hypothetical protein
VTRYRTIVADPPWDVQRLASPGSRGFGTQDGTLKSIRLEYPTMGIAEIAALPVKALADDDAHLYVWTINRYVEETYGIARAWGFEPKTLLTWAKAPMGLGPGGAFSQTTEHILFCRRGRDIATARIDSTWWQWAARTSLGQARCLPGHRRARLPRLVRRTVRPTRPPRVGHLGQREPRDGRVRNCRLSRHYNGAQTPGWFKPFKPPT